MQAVQEELVQRGLVDAEELAKVIDLLEDGITLTKNLARGLQPVAAHSGGLMQALQDFAALTNDIFKVSCRFECDAPITITDAVVANHLYQIAREATANAVKHGRAHNIVISLDASDDTTMMRVQDDGLKLIKAERTHRHSLDQLSHGRGQFPVLKDLDALSPSPIRRSMRDRYANLATGAFVDAKRNAILCPE
jgi:signal transduction histidine kinase